MSKTAAGVQDVASLREAIQCGAGRAFAAQYLSQSLSSSEMAGWWSPPDFAFRTPCSQCQTAVRPQLARQQVGRFAAAVGMDLTDRVANYFTDRVIIRAILFMIYSIQLNRRATDLPPFLIPVC